MQNPRAYAGLQHITFYHGVVWWDAILFQVNPPPLSLCIGSGSLTIHLNPFTNSWVESATFRIKCLSQKKNPLGSVFNMDLASRVQCANLYTTTVPPCPHLINIMVIKINCLLMRSSINQILKLPIDQILIHSKYYT